MSIDPVFPLPEPDFLWVHTLSWRHNDGDNVTVDEDGKWTYDDAGDNAFTGYLTAPDPREVERAAANGVILSAVCLAPYTTGVADEDTVIAGSGSGVQPILVGTYTVEVVRPNPSHLRILLSRITDETLPAHDPGLVHDALIEPPTVEGGL